MIFLRTFVTKLIYYSQESNFVDKVDFKGEFTIALKFISAKSFQNVIGTVRNNNATELPQKLCKKIIIIKEKIEEHQMEVRNKNLYFVPLQIQIEGKNYLDGVDIDKETFYEKVIAVMGNLNPLLRDTADFTHKLWDHLFIMSDFQLDVDSPYPQPSRQELTTVPRRMPYSSGHIEYKHYGKYVERMIRRLADEKNPQVVSRTVDNLARYMRTKSYEYNQEHPSNEVIIKDIKKMSGNAIQIDEVALNNIRSDYKQPFMAHPQKGQKGQKGAQQRQQKNRNQHQSRNFNGKNGGARHNTSK